MKSNISNWSPPGFFYCCPFQHRFTNATNRGTTSPPFCHSVKSILSAKQHFYPLAAICIFPSDPLLRRFHHFILAGSGETGQRVKRWQWWPGLTGSGLVNTRPAASPPPPSPFPGWRNAACHHRGAMQPLSHEQGGSHQWWPIMAHGTSEGGRQLCSPSHRCRLLMGI